MPFTTISGGLTLTVPTNGTTNWGTTVESLAWTPISNHRHTGSGDGNQIITASIADDQVTIAKLSKNTGRFQQATLTPGGTTETIDWDNGSKVILDLSSATGNVTLTLNNPATGGDYRIKVIQGVTPRTLIWPAAVLWPQGEEPSQFSTASTTDLINLDYDGTNYYGSWDLDYS